MGKIIRDEVLQSSMVAIVDDKGKRITYKELAESAIKMSHVIEKRSIVFFLCDRQAETAEILYKLLYADIVPLLLSADINRELLDNLIAIYRPLYIYCNVAHEIRNVYPYGIELESHILLKTKFKRYEIHPDVAVLLSTSGTTGSPKLVKLSYENLYNSAEQVCSCVGIRSGQKGISPLSMSYVYGFTFYIWHWHCGATMLTTEESVISSKFNEFYRKESANHFAGTPYTYQMLQRIQFWSQEKLEYLHWAMSAGSQMSDRDQECMVSVMKDKFWITYGQTECTGSISGMNFDENNIKLGSVGRALGETKVAVDDKTGELILKSRNICMGYVNDIAQLADGDVNQGVLHTGDVGYMDSDGCIYLKGRLTRYVKILGKRVSLDDIENYLRNRYPGVEFACVGSDDQVSVFHSKTENNLDEEIPIMLNRSMKIPHKFANCLCIAKIQRNDAGKIIYTELEEIGKKREGAN